MGRLDAEPGREALDDVVRRYRPVAVHDVVQVAGRETGLGREAAVGDPGLLHQPLDRRAERLLAVAPPARHQAIPLPKSATATRRSSPVFRSRTSTAPSSSVLLPTVTLIGQPIRSASANFSPARRSRSSRRT